jgi:hypothetical protein
MSEYHFNSSTTIPVVIQEIQDLVSSNRTVIIDGPGVYPRGPLTVKSIKCTTNNEEYPLLSNQCLVLDIETDKETFKTKIFPKTHGFDRYKDGAKRYWVHSECLGDINLITSPQ